MNVGQGKAQRKWDSLQATAEAANRRPVLPLRYLKCHICLTNILNLIALGLVFLKRLARQIGTDVVDPSQGVGEVEDCVRPTAFPGAIVMQDRQEAIAVAQETQSGESEMTIWVDGARSKEGKAGPTTAVTQDGSGRWKERRWHLGTNKEVVDAELYVIAEALCKAGAGMAISAKRHASSSSSSRTNFQLGIFKPNKE